MASRVEITCHCGKARETVLLDTTLPAPSTLCHCNTCRWTTGTLFQSVLPLREHPKSTSLLSRYQSSETKSRYFCGVCGTHMYHNLHRNDTWYVAAGVVERVLADEQVSSCRLQRIAEHQFVADTGDGGLAVCLAESSQTPIRLYMHGVDGGVVNSLSEDQFSHPGDPVHTKTHLRAACHCGSVEFFLSRPSEASGTCTSPWPDLLRPLHSCDPANPEDEKWWLRGSSRYLAGTCACRTCRLGVSSPITAWAFIPRTNLSRTDGAPIDAQTDTLRHYQSSEGRMRGFCIVCGASAFLRIDFRPDLLDINVGLFRADEGARAETWFEWVTDRVSFIEEALDTDFVSLCESSLSRLENPR